MVDLPGIIWVIIFSTEHVDGMPAVPEGEEPRVDGEVQSAAQQQYKQRDTPNEITEVNKKVFEDLHRVIRPQDKNIGVRKSNLNS